MINYVEKLPKTPYGLRWGLSWIDKDKKDTLVIALYSNDQIVHRKLLAIDIYGIAGFKETTEWMLNKWLDNPVLPVIKDD